jgi:hypothetical protein
MRRPFYHFFNVDSSSPQLLYCFKCEKLAAPDQFYSIKLRYRKNICRACHKQKLKEYKRQPYQEALRRLKEEIKTRYHSVEKEEVAKKQHHWTGERSEEGRGGGNTFGAKHSLPPLSPTSDLDTNGDEPGALSPTLVTPNKAQAQNQCRTPALTPPTFTSISSNPTLPPLLELLHHLRPHHLSRLAQYFNHHSPLSQKLVDPHDARFLWLDQSKPPLDPRALSCTGASEPGKNEHGQQNGHGDSVFPYGNLVLVTSKEYRSYKRARDHLRKGTNMKMNQTRIAKTNSTIIKYGLLDVGQVEHTVTF